MKLVLQKQVQGLGNTGDIVIVKDGYARNALIPQGLAKFADSKALKESEALQKKAAAAENERLEKLSKQLEAVNGKTFTISAKADEKSNLFGSVSRKDVLDLVNAGGGTFTDSDLTWDPQKKTGKFEAVLSPDGEQRATVTIDITAEE